MVSSSDAVTPAVGRLAIYLYDTGLPAVRLVVDARCVGDELSDEASRRSATTRPLFEMELR